VSRKSPGILAFVDAIALEGNWVQTVSGKSWWVILRLYGALEPWFDKTWQPDDIKLVE
jgi:hypothetical protein